MDIANSAFEIHPAVVRLQQQFGRSICSETGPDREDPQYWEKTLFVYRDGDLERMSAAGRKGREEYLVALREALGNAHRLVTCRVHRESGRFEVRVLTEVPWQKT